MTIGTAYNKSLPPGGRPTSAPPKTVGGAEWRCYSIGIMRTEWRTPDDRCAVQTMPGRETFTARVDGQYLKGGGGRDRAKRFRSQANAMLAALKAAGA